MKQTANNSERGRKDARNSRSTDTCGRSLGDIDDPLHHYRRGNNKAQRALNCCNARIVQYVSRETVCMVGAARQTACQVSTFPLSIIGYVWGISSKWISVIVTIASIGACLVCREISQGKERTKREYLER